MPRTKLADRFVQKAPPVDWLWAAVLERKTVLGYDLKLMARVAGVTYETMRRYIRQSPWTWEESARAAILKEFGLKAEVNIQQIERRER